MSDFQLVSGACSPRSCFSSHSSTTDAGCYLHMPGTAQAHETTTSAVRLADQSIADTVFSDDCGRANPQLPVQRRPFFKPQLSMRPIITHVNILVAGASATGKSSFIRVCSELLTPSCNSRAQAGQSSAAAMPCGTGQIADPHAVLLPGPDAFATALDPIVVPEACRELVYKFQDCPGHGCTLDSAGYLEAAMTYLMQQQQKDYEALHGCKSLPAFLMQSVACGFLEHSTTACIYFMPSHGPSKLDLVLMSALSQHVTLIPVIGKADCMRPEEAEACCKQVQHMLSEPAEFVPGLDAVKTYRSAEGLSHMLLNTRTKDADADADAGVLNVLGLLAGDEVYNLLESAWSRYTYFCGRYEAANKQLSSLVAEACQSVAVAWTPAIAAMPVPAIADEYKLKCAKLTAELQQQKEKTEQFATQLAEEKEEKQALRQQLRESQANMDELSGELDQYKQKCAGLAAELHQQKGKAEQYRQLAKANANSRTVEKQLLLLEWDEAAHRCCQDAAGLKEKKKKKKETKMLQREMMLQQEEYLSTYHF